MSVLGAPHTQQPRAVYVDQNAAYPSAITVLKAGGAPPEDGMLRRVKYLNNSIEQDYRFTKRLVRPGHGFGSFTTALKTLVGYDTMHMICNGQIMGTGKGKSREQAAFVAQVFGLVAQGKIEGPSRPILILPRHPPYLCNTTLRVY